MHRSLPDRQERERSKQKEQHTRKGLRKNQVSIGELQIIWHDYRAWRTERKRNREIRLDMQTEASP